MINERKSLVLINEETGERKDFTSITAAATFLKTTFSNVQRAAIYNGTWKGWKVYESPESIKRHIIELEEQLKVLEG